MLTQEDIRKLVCKFLSQYRFRRYLNNDMFFGEMMTAANLAMMKYNKDRGLPSTLIYKYCLNRMRTLLRQEKEFYSRHNSELSPTMSIKQKSPLDSCLYEEAKNAVSKSKLSKRTKDIVLLKMEHPEETLQELATRVGLTFQAISLHINSAEQYFFNNKINLD